MRVTTELGAVPVLTVLVVMVLMPPQVIELNSALSAEAESMSNRQVAEFAGVRAGQVCDTALL